MAEEGPFLEPLPPIRGPDGSGSGTFQAYVKRPTTTASRAGADAGAGLARALPLFLLHHGAGLCGRSFDLMARHLYGQLGGAVALLTWDARGHGHTTVQPEHWDLATFAADLVHVARHAFPELEQEQNAGPASSLLPILVGHSLGGAVMAHVATMAQPVLGRARILGTAVIDIVEGTALDSLGHMQQVLGSMPSSFASTDAAVTWAVRNKRPGNPSSARLSLPPQLQQQQLDGPWTWRTDLRASTDHWRSWFTGLSASFLSMRGARLLILAGTDRLDKELTIGQMQGKFQLVLYPESGHAIHEEVPEQVARTLHEFWERNRPGLIKRFPIPPLAPGRN